MLFFICVSISSHPKGTPRTVFYVCVFIRHFIVFSRGAECQPPTRTARLGASGWMVDFLVVKIVVVLFSLLLWLCCAAVAFSCVNVLSFVYFSSGNVLTLVSDGMFFLFLNDGVIK